MVDCAENNAIYANQIRIKTEIPKTEEQIKMELFYKIAELIYEQKNL